MSEGPAGHVLALHGWAMPDLAVRAWCNSLRSAGFQARAFTYRSRAATLDETARALAEAAAALPGQGPVHLVGHSMGGLVILHTLARHRLGRLGRVVLVGTPFQGSAVADRVRGLPAGRWLLGRSITQWQPSDPHEAPAWPGGLQLGTIAGTRSLGIGRLVARLPAPHDGTVTLDETRVPFATDRLVLPVTHTQMLVSADVQAQIAHFLRHGAFARP